MSEKKKQALTPRQREEIEDFLHTELQGLARRASQRFGVPIPGTGGQSNMYDKNDNVKTTVVNAFFAIPVSGCGNCADISLDKAQEAQQIGVKVANAIDGKETPDENPEGSFH